MREGGGIYIFNGPTNNEYCSETEVVAKVKESVEKDTVKVGSSRK